MKLRIALWQMRLAEDHRQDQDYKIEKVERIIQLIVRTNMS
jgi:hypothetical protein